MKLQCVTPAAVLSYPNLITPGAQYDPDKPLVYSATLVFPEGVDCSPIEEIVENAIVKGLDGARRPSDIFNPLQPVTQDAAERAGDDRFVGALKIKATNKEQPKLFADTSLAPVMDDEQLYAGCIVRADVSAWYWSNPEKRKYGVKLFLNAVMKVDDGARIGRDPRSLFEMETEASAYDQSVPF